MQLRFDALGSPNLPDDLKSRLWPLAGQRMTREGVIVITADSFRSQARNRQDALERLVAMLRKAAVRPAIRRPTRPTRASKERRIGAKNRRSAVKADRQPPRD